MLLVVRPGAPSSVRSLIKRRPANSSLLRPLTTNKMKRFHPGSFDVKKDVDTLTWQTLMPWHQYTEATSNKCIATSHKCLASSNKKLVETGPNWTNPPGRPVQAKAAKAAAPAERSGRRAWGDHSFPRSNVDGKMVQMTVFEHQKRCHPLPCLLEGGISICSLVCVCQGLFVLP